VVAVVKPRRAAAPCGLKRSSHLPKIIFPAVVCRTEVDGMSMSCQSFLRAFPRTTIGAVVQIGDALVDSLPSFGMKTSMISPGSTIGFNEFANSFDG